MSALMFDDNKVEMPKKNIETEEKKTVEVLDESCVIEEKKVEVAEESFAEEVNASSVCNSNFNMMNNMDMGMMGFNQQQMQQMMMMMQAQQNFN